MSPKEGPTSSIPPTVMQLALDYAVTLVLDAEIQIRVRHARVAGISFELGRAPLAKRRVPTP